MTVTQDVDELARLVSAPGMNGEPFAHYQELRELSPVHRSKRSGMTLVSRLADCRQVLNDSETFRVVDAAWMESTMPGWKPSPSQEQFLSSLFFRNPPDHTRLRRQISRSFTSRRLRSLGPMVEREVRRAFERLAAVPAGEVVDFQELVSVPLSLAVFGGLLGIAEEDQPRCWELLNEAVPAPDPTADQEARQAVQRRADTAALEMSEFFSRLVGSRRADPGDDLISTCLVESADDPDQLSDSELALTMLPVFGAGVTTLGDTVGNIMHTLLANPEALARLRSGDFAEDRALAEIFRYCGGYHITRRYTTRDVELGGVELPAGSVVVLLLASANRDPQAFHEPELFDIDRTGNGSLAFGAGIHHCLGAALSKLLGEALCRELHRVPGLRADGPAEWRPSMLFFGPVRLPVLVHP